MSTSSSLLTGALMGNAVTPASNRKDAATLLERELNRLQSGKVGRRDANEQWTFYSAKGLVATLMILLLVQTNEPEN